MWLHHVLLHYNTVILHIVLILLLLMMGCAVPVRPIAHIEQDPMRPGVYHFTPDHDQEPQIGPAVTGGLGLIAAFLPSPYRELLGVALAAWVGEKRKQSSDRKLKQTVDGIETAKADLEPEAINVLHGALAESMDDNTKKTVWDMRP